MLAITKTINEDITSYGYYTINGMATKEWLKALNNKMPDNISCIIDDDNPLAEKINEYGSFEPIFDNKGELIDVEEVIYESEEINNEISLLLDNLDKTDYQVIKNMEVLAVTLAEEYDIELPYEAKSLHKTRQSWRDLIEYDISRLPKQEQSYSGVSQPEGKGRIKQYLLDNYGSSAKILDVGVGEGAYSKLLKKHFPDMDAVEICESYVEKFGLKDKYENVYVADIRDFEFEWYDIIILGDVLEHLSYEDSLELLERLKGKCDLIIISVPYEYEQYGTEENPHEEHLQYDLTIDNMRERYPMLKELIVYLNVGIYLYGNAVEVE